MKILSIILATILLAATVSRAAALYPLHEVSDQSSTTFPLAIVHTPYGDIHVRLRPDAAPKTVANFINLVHSGFYTGSVNNNGNGTTFYRYEAGFVLQGGNMNAASNSTVPLEYNIPNKQWTVGLARDNDPNSGSSEFFINLVDNSAHLCPPNNAYAVFAEVTKGFDAIKAMEQLPVVEDQGIHFFKAPMPPILSIHIVNN